MSSALRLSLLVVVAAVVAPAAAPAPAAAGTGPCLPGYPNGSQCTASGRGRCATSVTATRSTPRSRGTRSEDCCACASSASRPWSCTRTAPLSGPATATRSMPPRGSSSSSGARSGASASVALPREPLAGPPAALGRGPLQGPLARRRPDPGRRGPRAVVAGPQRGRRERPLQRADPARGGGAARASSRPTACGIGPNEGHAAQAVGELGRRRHRLQRRQRRVGQVRNLDPVNPLPLTGWYLRDSGLRRFTFPPGTVLAPGRLDDRLRG